MIQDPAYAEFFTRATIACRESGYALAVHGSMTRDLDVVAIPWIAKATDLATLLHRVKHRTEWKDSGNPISDMPHGRKSHVFIHPAFDDPRYVDFAVMPNLENG